MAPAPAAAARSRTQAAVADDEAAPLGGSRQVRERLVGLRAVRDRRYPYLGCPHDQWLVPAEPGRPPPARCLVGRRQVGRGGTCHSVKHQNVVRVPARASAGTARPSGSAAIPTRAKSFSRARNCLAASAGSAEPSGPGRAVTMPAPSTKTVSGSSASRSTGQDAANPGCRSR